MRSLLPTVFLVSLLLGGVPLARADFLAHTFSIVARDPDTGQLGVAVQSHWPGVGSMVSWARAGVGVVATQSFVRPRYGPDCLDLLARGLSPEQAFREASRGDRGLAGRQVALVDHRGRVFAHTGSGNIPVAHHQLGEGFSVQANLMVDESVVPAMARAYRESEGPLGERLLAALRAGQAAGGDLRGKQAAGLRVVAARASGDPEEDVVLDLRVDDHPRPVEELARLLALRRSYDLGNRVQGLVGRGRLSEAAALWRQLDEGCPGCHEPRFWYLVALLERGEEGAARPHWEVLRNLPGNWGEALRRVARAGLLGGEAGSRRLEQFLAGDPLPMGGEGP